MVTKTTVTLRYRFGGPATIGRKTPLPSGNIYCIHFGGPRTIEVDARDVEALTAFRGECCTGGKRPLFEIVES